MKDEKVLKQGELDYIWSLMPAWVREIPSEEHSFDPTFFGTLSREGDIEVHKKVCRLLNQKLNIDG